MASGTVNPHCLESTGKSIPMGDSFRSGWTVGTSLGHFLDGWLMLYYSAHWRQPVPRQRVLKCAKVKKASKQAAWMCSSLPALDSGCGVACCLSRLPLSLPIRNQELETQQSLSSALLILAKVFLSQQQKWNFKKDLTVAWREMPPAALLLYLLSAASNWPDPS